MGAKRKTAALYTTLVMIVLIALVVSFWIALKSSGEGDISTEPIIHPGGGGGINYDPETYPDDIRGIKPSERPAYLATQAAASTPANDE